MPQPGEHFAEIAVALFELARLEAWNVEGCEHLVVEVSEHRVLPGMADSLARLRRRAELIGEAHQYFKAMVDIEPEIKALLAKRSAAA
jgi:uncharacterized protein (DUF2342 family)